MLPPRARPPAWLRAVAVVAAPLVLASCRIFPEFPESLLAHDAGPTDGAGGIDVPQFDVPRMDAVVDVPMDVPRADSGDVPVGPCALGPAGPFTATSFADGISGALDLTFSGYGQLALVAQDVVMIDGTGSGFTFSVMPVNGIGLRYMPTGELAVTAPEVGGVRIVDSTGGVRPAAIGYHLPSGIAVHPNGAVFWADTTDGAIRRLAPTGGAVSLIRGDIPGVTYLALSADATRMYASSPASGRVVSIDFAMDGSVTAPAIYVEGIGTPAGLALDTCGYLYVAEQRNQRVLRVPPGGGSYEVAATLSFPPAGVAFGRGTGFDTRSLYVVNATSGAVFRIPVGIEGAAIVMPR